MTDNYNRDIIDYINARPEGFFKPAKKRGVICPLCHNGSGKDGTGIERIPNSNTYKCFKCGAAGDVLWFIASVNNLDCTNDFKEVLERAAVLYGISLPSPLPYSSAKHNSGAQNIRTNNTDNNHTQNIHSKDTYNHGTKTGAVSTDSLGADNIQIDYTHKTDTANGQTKSVQHNDNHNTHNIEGVNMSIKDTDKIDGENIHIDSVYNSNTEKERIDYTDYFAVCNSRAKDTDYFFSRGISEETVNKFNLGFDPNFTVGKLKMAAVILPTSKNSFTARSIARKQFIKQGRGDVFNISGGVGSNSPIFVVEGIFDALSIIEAGHNAIALGTISNNIFIDYLKENKPTQPLLLALDNDKPGKTAQEELKRKLDELKIEYFIADIFGENAADIFESGVGESIKNTDENAAENTSIDNTDNIYAQDIHINDTPIKDANEALLKYGQEEFSTLLSLAEMEIFRKKAEEKEDYLAQSRVYAYLPDFLNGIHSGAHIPTINTGFKKIDKVLGGGLYAGLYILGAISSLGKTTYIMQLADQLAQNGEDVLIFSLEMGLHELMAKSISRLSATIDLAENNSTDNAKTVREIMDGKKYADYKESEHKLIDNAIKKYSAYAKNIFIIEGVGEVTAFAVRETVKKHIEMTGKTPIVFVDYLQLLAPCNERYTDKQNTDKAVLELKRISRDFRLPVIAVSSFNRENYTAAVNMSAFKESGAIEYSSDVLIGLQLKGAGNKDFNADDAKNTYPAPRAVELKILKQRNGITGTTIEYKYYPQFNYFEEV